MNDYAPTYNRRQAYYANSAARDRVMTFLASMGFTFLVGTLFGMTMGLAL